MRKDSILVDVVLFGEGDCRDWLVYHNDGDNDSIESRTILLYGSFSAAVCAENGHIAGRVRDIGNGNV